MYSILLKLQNSTADRWKYLTNSDGSVYIASTLAEVETKIGELLVDYVLGSIKVVKNCIITNTISVIEQEPNE